MRRPRCFASQAPVQAPCSSPFGTVPLPPLGGRGEGGRTKGWTEGSGEGSREGGDARVSWTLFVLLATARTGLLSGEALSVFRRAETASAKRAFRRLGVVHPCGAIILPARDPLLHADCHQASVRSSGGKEGCVEYPGELKFLRF